jgi:tRNA1Val (adenine37-N6)-methyltransferase
MRYAQPEEYHHCMDSVLLAEFVAQQLRGTPITPHFQALDLCAGCGVVGFELASHLPSIKNFHFVEVQSIFEAYFEKNKQLTGNKNFRFLNQNYETMLLDPGNQYDLIISNPPYFSMDEGKLSGQPIQDRARFFLDSTFEGLLKTVVHLLKPDGEAFLLVKSGEKHGRDVLRTIQLTLMGTAKASIATDIRGTCVLNLKKSE